MRYNKVIYIGIIKDEQSNIVGGYAVANERNINEYNRRGFEVVTINYPVLKKKNALNIIIHLFGWVSLVCQSLVISLRNKSQAKNTLIHIAPFYKYFLIVEYPVLRIIKLFNKNILIDIRAGSFISYYENYGFLYRKLLSAFLKQAKYITVEGKKYIQFIKEKINPEGLLHYYPNYVEDNQILPEQRAFGNKPIKLIYFGRVTPEKGIETLIEAHNLLKNKYKDLKTIIIGGGSKHYIDRLNRKIDNESITIFPPQDSKFINEELIDSHFFVFPTIHKGEGHSNAISESMAHGVVPIAADNGFNKDIVDNAGIILPINVNAQNYFNEIDMILTSKTWELYSERSRQRIISNFSNKIVSDNFFEFINNHQ